MQPVLILTDPEKITQHKAFLTKAVTYLQLLYDKFKAIGIEVTLEEMRVLIHFPNGQTPNYISDFVAQKMLDKAGIPDFNGVPIKKQKLLEMMDVPDTTDITAFVKGASSYLGHLNQTGIEPNLFEIINGVVAKKEDAEGTIEAKHNHYTQNDRGTEVAKKLNAIVQTLEDYKNYAGNAISDRFWKDLELDDMGLENNGGKLRPSLRFVREQEKAYTGKITS